MNATLLTNSEQNFLEMRDIRVYGDNSGGACVLNLKSSPFQAEIDFFFDYPSLSTFSDQLEFLQKSLVGTAKLGNLHENPYIQFDGDGRGHISVSGKLCSTASRMQHLTFEFETDQTALTPFIDELRAVVEIER